MRSLADKARSFTRHVAEHAEEFRALDTGQHPEALFITCSDARVVPALITDARPGELFELRTAGNIVPEYRGHPPTSEAATIEYAVRVLGVSHVIVCGHSRCGVVSALAQGHDLTAAPAVRGWLEHVTRRPVQDHPRSPDLAQAVQRHTVAQAQRLRAHPCVAERLAEGSLSVHVWYYEVHTGVVRVHRSDEGHSWFQPL